jgi:hypothetical protein
MSAKESALIPIVKIQRLEYKKTTTDIQEQYEKYLLLYQNP